MSTCEKDQSDRIGNLFRHLIGQRRWGSYFGTLLKGVWLSFYPLFPPLLGACLDAGFGSMLEISTKLDVIITPSDLISYAKFLQAGDPPEQLPHMETSSDGNCLCLNPGFSVKSTRGGTYAILNITPEESTTTEISKICRVDIMHI